MTTENIMLLVVIFLLIFCIMFLAVIFLQRKIVSFLEAENDHLKGLCDQITKENKHLKNLSTFDYLTKVGNRRYLDTVLEEEIDRSIRLLQPLSFGLVDMNKFSDVNTVLGHDSGSKVLTRVAEVIVFSLRKTDRVFRYGGDEFAIVMPNTSSEEAKKILTRVLVLIEEDSKLMEIARGKVSIGASVGITEYSNDHIESDYFADKALIMSDVISQSSEALTHHAKTSTSIATYKETHTT